MGYPVLKNLPQILRDSKFKITATLKDDRIISIERGDTTEKVYGVAIDIGTTTIVASLMSLKDGMEIASHAILNPQRIYGEDVMTRMNFAINKGKELLQQRVVKAINFLIDMLCKNRNIEKENIYELCIVGNTAMIHFLLGIDTKNMALSPYIGVFDGALTVTCKDLGINYGFEIFIPPCPSPFIGADIVAGILATGLYRIDSGLFIDIGTNGEVVLKTPEGFYACSTAAGPAFEGANISCGMLAEEGAIEEVKIIDGEVIVKTIGDSPPKGICGSGLLSAVSCLLDMGIIESSGRMKENFLLHQDIFISQGDVRNLQLAKGAIRAGVEILLKEAGIKHTDKVFIAGAFGYHVKPEDIVKIGLLPMEFDGKIEFVGNSAIEGAKELLCNVKARNKIGSFCMKTIELSIHQDFERVFIESLKL
jgi:uncharacterized 2Fe-2S/4Fe-4S cluster protein (DUF4445 family)